MPDEQTFHPEETPSAQAEMDAALIMPLFFVAVVLAVVTFVMVILTGAPT